MSSIRKNREILTGGKKYANKRAKAHAVEEVLFDKESRKEYLTGFHKRKLQRKKKAEEFYKEQARLERIEERKQMREERQRELEQKISEFNSSMRRITDFDEESYNSDENKSNKKALVSEHWEGFDKASSDINEEEGSEEHEIQTHGPLKGILQKKEVYHVEREKFMPDTVVDEETTVTVETLDNPMLAGIQDALEIAARSNNVNLNKSEEILEESIKKAKNYAVLCGVAEPKKSRKKFRYLTKAERRENLRKEKSKKYSKKQ